MTNVANKIKQLSDYFAVATEEEALELKTFCPDANVLLFGYFEKARLKQLLDNKINLTVFDTKTLVRLNSFAKKYNKSFFIHIKFDCGMNRLGYKTTNEGLAIIKTLKACKYIILNGLYTHFASGNLKDRAFLLECKHRFDQQVTYLTLYSGLSALSRPRRSLSHNTGSLIVMPSESSRT